MKAKEFKTHCINSVLEYAGGGIYNFYDMTDFFFNYNVGTNKFESGLELSASQLLILANKIIVFHNERVREEIQEQERHDLMEDPYDESYFNTQNL